MWDSDSDRALIRQSRGQLARDLPCPRCGHAVHTFLACSDDCDCTLVVMPGVYAA